MIAAVLAAAAVSASPAPLPRDVRRFVERAEACLHFAGEEAYDAERGRFLARQMRRLRCDALETDAKRLERRHAARPDAAAAVEAAMAGFR